jgi:hypothetical protein
MFETDELHEWRIKGGDEKLEPRAVPERANYRTTRASPD